MASDTYDTSGKYRDDFFHVKTNTEESGNPPGFNLDMYLGAYLIRYRNTR